MSKKTTTLGQAESEREKLEELAERIPPNSTNEGAAGVLRLAARIAESKAAKLTAPADSRRAA